VRSYRDVATVNARLRDAVFLGLMNEGILMASNLVGALSTAISEGEVGSYLSAFRRVLERQR
jgi:glutamate-1-semialdehyde aminotransferase